MTALRTYVGTHVIKLDVKGRLFVPAQYRPDFVERAKLMYRGDHLALYSESGFDNVVARMEELLREGRLGRSDIDDLMQMTENATVDSQGRLIIPNIMRLAVNLDAGLVTVGGRLDYLSIVPGGEDESAAVETYRTKADQALKFKDLGF